MSNLEEKYLISQANSLIEARYTITKNEQLLLFAMISLIEPSDKEFLNFSVTVDQLSLILNIHRKTALREFDKITDRLLSRVIKIPTKKGWEKLQWISNAKVEADVVFLKFHDDLKPLLLALKATGNFTQIKLGLVVQFRSIYTIRIYQILKEYNSKRYSYIEFSLIDFRDIMLGKDSKSYPLYKNFRNHIIDVAKRELEQKDKITGFYKSDLSFRLETRRTGRKISHLKFIIIPQTTAPIVASKEIIEVEAEYKPFALPEPNTEITQSLKKIIPLKHEITPEIATMKLLGISEKKSFELKEKHGSVYIQEKLSVLSEMQEIRKITSPSGFLLKAISENYQSQALLKEEKEAEIKRKIDREISERRLNEYETNLINSFGKEIRNEYLQTLSETEKSDLWDEIVKVFQDSGLYKYIKEDKLNSPMIGMEIIKRIPNFLERKTLYMQEKMDKKRKELGLTKD